MPEAAPLGPRLDELLRRCVECGLCLPHCATWLATGSEVQSPRGRLTLLGEALSRQRDEAPRAFLEAFDLCIGCRACEAACPSGVPFTLLEKGQELARTRLPGGTTPFPLPGLARQLDRPGFLRLIRRLGRPARSVFELALGRGWRRKLDTGPAGGLARLLGSVPWSESSDQRLRRQLEAMCRDGGGARPAAEAAPAGGPERAPAVAFFTGCANQALLPATSRRLLELLTGAGCQVETVPGQDCCGALASHTGRPGRAAALRRRNRQAFAGLAGQDVAILVEAAGCGLEFRDRYPEDFAARVTDAAVLLDSLALPPLGPVPLKVAYHDPCHARHGQGIVDEPRRLLRRIPALHLVEPLEAEVCCGSGGAWGLNHPELSADLGRRKAANLAATGADLIVTSNPGCLGQIRDGLAFEAPDLPIMPLTDLLWFAWQRARSAPGNPHS